MYSSHEYYQQATDGGGASSLSAHYNYSHVSRFFHQRCRVHLTYHPSYPSFSDLCSKVYIILVRIYVCVCALVGQVMEVVSVGVVRQHGR